MTEKHRRGAECEARVCLHLITRGWYCFTQEFRATGPCDIVALHEDGHKILVDAKSDARRINPGRRVHSRINRVPTEMQRRLGVIFGYVSKAGDVDFVGKITDDVRALL